MSEPTVTVVLIEDEKQIRRFVRASLEGGGHCRARGAETGKQGLVEAATRKPDLVIVDLGLPDTDGIDVIRELRSWTELPVIVLSARTQEEEKVAALDAGADDYLTKPFGVSELMARIRAQLRRRNQAAASETPQVSFGAGRGRSGAAAGDARWRARASDADRISTARDARAACRAGAHAPAVAARGVGAVACGKPPLFAHLYGASAAETGARCRRSPSIS